MSLWYKGQRSGSLWRLHLRLAALTEPFDNPSVPLDHARWFRVPVDLLLNTSWALDLEEGKVDVILNCSLLLRYILIRN